MTAGQAVTCFRRVSFWFSVMLVKTEALVLHSIKYGDGKLVVDMFTAAFGRMAFIVAVRRPSGRGGMPKQLFQPMAQLSVECDVRPRMKLQKLRSASLSYPYAGIPFDPMKLPVALFAADFLYYALRGEQENAALFAYLCGGMQWLDRCGSRYANFHLVFLMRLSRFLGFYPNLDGYFPGDCFDLRSGCFCHGVPVHRDFLAPDEARKVLLMMRMSFANMHLFRMSRIERNRLVDIIIMYYRIHIPDFPELKSLAVLRELFV